MVTTIYKPTPAQQQNSMHRLPVLSHRFCSYMVELLRTWFGSPDNILEEAQKGLLFRNWNTPGQLAESRVSIELGYPKDRRDANFPCLVNVFSANTQVQYLGAGQQIATAGPNRSKGMRQEVTFGYDVNILLQLPGYPATQLIAEQLLLYLTACTWVIKQDSGVSSFMVERLESAKQDSQGGPGRSKDICSATILMKVYETVTAEQNTVGPVLKSVTIGS